MRQRPLDAERWRPGADGDTALEQRPDALDQRCRQFAQVRQGALLRPALLVAKALAQQHGGGRGAVRHGLDEHGGSRFAHRQQDGNPYMDTTAKELTLNPLSGRAYQVIHSKNFGLNTLWVVAETDYSSTRAKPPSALLAGCWIRSSSR